MKSDSVRCFVAIEIPESIQDKLVEMQNQIRSKMERVSWTKRGNFHLTLKFLGEVDNRRIDEISTALQEISTALQYVTKEIKPFSLEIGGVGAFPNLVCPRVLWVGLKQGVKPTISLTNAINRELIQIGFPEDTRFHPHITLARMKRQINLNSFTDLFKKFETVKGTLITVKEFTLVRSDLHPKGAVYSPINKYTIGKGESR